GGAEPGRRSARAAPPPPKEPPRRAGIAVENAKLYREVEERAQAARVLETVGDGVFLIDLDGAGRLWNRAAESITKLSRAEVVGKKAGDVLPGWEHAAATVPLELDGEERWLSIAGVAFDEGTVYAFRDLTDERVL